jgi:transposase-like protein
MLRDGVVANRPSIWRSGVDCEDAKQVLSLWVGLATGESARFWLSVLSELKGRGNKSPGVIAGRECPIMSWQREPELPGS